MKVNKLILLFTVFAFMLSCNSGDRGELVGVKGKKWHPEKPYGMTLVPGGAFIMGKSDDDLAGMQDSPTRTVTVRAFYMDETEITNSEYRQFVENVRDNILREKLAEMADLEGKTPGNGDIGDYAYRDADTTGLNAYQRYMINTYGNEQREINTDIELAFDTNDYPDELYAEVMDGMYLPLEES